MKRKASGKNTKLRLVDLSESSLVNDLRDPFLAASYLDEVLLSGGLAPFLLAIRNVAAANGGMKTLAVRTKLGRESMYKTLSKAGNPQFSTLQQILENLGLRFSIAPIDEDQKVA